MTTDQVYVISQGALGPQGAQGPPGPAGAGTGVGSLTGTGSPEGVLTASVGTEYIDLAATNGAVKWVKWTGTGNTGWRVVMGDTGWRKILSWTAGVQDGTNQIGTIATANVTIAGTGFVCVRRQLRQVWLAMPNSVSNSLSMIAVGPTNLLTSATWPLGFRSSNHYREAALVTNTIIPPQRWDFANSVASPRIGVDTTNRDLRNASAEWVTDDAWPVGALPGVALAD